MYLGVIAVLHYNNNDGVIHACVIIACIWSKYSKCISAIKRILYTTAMYISSSSFMYLCFPLYCDAYLKSSALRVGVKTLHNTITLNSYFLLKLYPRVVLMTNYSWFIKLTFQTSAQSSLRNVKWRLTRITNSHYNVFRSFPDIIFLEGYADVH